jgi:hypothetical protein
MKFYKLIFIILIVFLKTGNVLSSNNIFDVNNIEIEKTGKISYDALANQAILKGFKQLINKVLLKKDTKKLQDLQFVEIKELVNYYQVLDSVDDKTAVEKINFNISFDKEKIHKLFYKTGISYSKITDKELFILPILKKNNQIFIYNQNYFYSNLNEVDDTELIEFILPLENIEIIKNINLNINNLLNLDLRELFSEYSGKNLALVLIEEKNIFFNVEILGKKIVKNIKLNKINLNEEELNKKIINEIKQELINLIKSQNLIDVTIPSFLNVQFKVSKNNNLVELTSKLNKIDLIENIYIQEFNNESVFLKIKYLGKLAKIIKQLENKNIILKLNNGQWNIKII